jgi:hypothetical protein
MRAAEGDGRMGFMRKTEDAAVHEAREFLKDAIRLKIDFSQTDQSRGVPPPPMEKPAAADALRILKD